MTGVFPRSQYIVTTRFTLRPDASGRMRVLSHDLTTTSRASPGCTLYHFTESSEKPGIFFLYMIWRDEAAFRAYETSPFVRAFVSTLAQGMLAEPPVTEIWRSLG